MKRGHIAACRCEESSHGDRSEEMVVLTAPVAILAWHDHRAAQAVFVLVIGVADTNGIRPRFARRVDTHPARPAVTRLPALRREFLDQATGRGRRRVVSTGRRGHSLLGGCRSARSVPREYNRAFLAQQLVPY